MVNKRDDEGLTALHWAVMCDHAAHCALLLQNQGDITVGDNEGRTPVHYAVSRKLLSCLQVSWCVYVCECVSVCVCVYTYVFMCACVSFFSLSLINSLKALLEMSPASVNIADSSGRTPLHSACGDGR